MRRFEQNGYLPLLVLTIAIQGTVLVSQTLASLFIPISRTGAIRTFESVASVAILCGSLGTQTLAIREIAAARDDVERARILNELLFLPFVGAGALGLLGVALMLSGHSPAVIGSTTLPLAMTLVLLVSLTRLLSGAAQGLFRVGDIYRSVIVGSGAAILFHLGGAFGGSLATWIIGRCLGEAVLLASVGLALIRAYPPFANFGVPPWARILAQMRTGMSVNLGLILRMTADAVPIVMMGRISAATVIGHFGIATLALTLATLPIAVSTQLALPRLAAASRAGQRRTFQRLLLRVFASAVGLAGGATVIGLLGRPFADATMQDSITAVLVILWTLPLRSLSLGLGALSLARSNYIGPLIINLIELLVLMTIMVIQPFGGSIWTPMLAVFIGAGVSLVGMTVQTLLFGDRGKRPGIPPDDIAVVD